MLSKLEEQSRDLLSRWSRHEIYMCDNTNREVRKLIDALTEQDRASGLYDIFTLEK